MEGELEKKPPEASNLTAYIFQWDNYLQDFANHLRNQKHSLENEESSTERLQLQEAAERLETYLFWLSYYWTQFKAWDNKLRESYFRIYNQNILLEEEIANLKKKIQMSAFFKFFYSMFYITLTIYYP